MIDTAALPLFLLAATLVIVVPGPSVFYIVARGVDQGRVAGLVSTLGVGAGGLVHVAGAALGLSALLASSAVAFATIKYIGAAYLIYLGLRRLLTPAESMPETPVRHQSPRRLFHEGLLVNLFNPKTALFFLAFLPQFVNPAAGPVSIQVMLLGGMFVTIALVSDGIYALAAGGLGKRLRRSPAVASGMRWFSGGVYIALGTATAIAGGSRSSP